MKDNRKSLMVITTLFIFMTLAVVSAVFGNNGLKTFDGFEKLGSVSRAGHSDADNDYLYTASVFIDGNSINSGYSNDGYINGGKVTEKGARGFTLVDSVAGHNGIIINNSDYTVSDATISMETKADGSQTCDFTGQGAAIAIYGDSKVRIKNTHIKTSGVATTPIFVDSAYGVEKGSGVLGPVVTIEDCDILSLGGTIYKGYRNSAGASNMIAPPWVLGIAGSSRATNLMGYNSTYSFINSSVSASQWAVISVDMGSNLRVNIVNTKMDLLGIDDATIGSEFVDSNNQYTKRSGYGTYIIGGAVECFYGVTMNVGTYATIFCDGTANFSGIKAGDPINIYDALDHKIGTYTFDKDIKTTVNSDTFGFMAHSGNNTLNMKGGTVINSKYSTFLIKADDKKIKSFTADVSDGCVLNNGNGVLIQIMDNDDATTGVDLSKGYPIFNTIHKENSFKSTGFPTKMNATSRGEAHVDYAFTDVALKGNIYNASGYEVNEITPCTSAPLAVKFNGKTTINGAIACTSAIHVTYEGSLAVADRKGLAFESPKEGLAFAKQYQNKKFSISNYYDIGQIANYICPTGFNTIDIALSDDAVWTVTGTSVITSLTITGSARVVVPKGVTLTVGDKRYTNCTVGANG